ncbi:AarF/ABC1/UbiB kinase family protein [Halomonas cibimaris]|uniref:AarF/ABC1/UbiB kinase family protein n=1 Tax=Halomonas cibimaris TaxID=657012 RepID=A0ABP7L3A2_9GAMM
MRERGRTRRLFGLGARTGGAVLKNRMAGSADWNALGEALFDGLSELRGPAMKLAQIVAQWDDVLPPELAEQLARLQRQAEPMPWPRIRETLVAEYGDLDACFRHIEPQPFASASMGQVHKAVTRNGETLVLKVQYPGLADALEGDLRQVKRIMRLGRWLKVSASRLDALFEELAAGLRDELDYRAEAQTLARYRERYRHEPRLCIPEPVEALCGERVLAMRYLPGTPLDEVAGDKARQQAATTLADWLTEELFTYGELHADPHAGNFAVDDDSRLIIYDFGAVIPVPEAVAPLFAPGEQDFADVRVHRRLRALSPRVWAAMDRLQPPADTLLLSRALNGHYWNMVRLGARLDMQRRCQPLLRWARAYS